MARIPYAKTRQCTRRNLGVLRTLLTASTTSCKPIPCQRVDLTTVVDHQRGYRAVLVLVKPRSSPSQIALEAKGATGRSRPESRVLLTLVGAKVFLVRLQRPTPYP